MFNNKINTYIFLFLFFCVISSKHIIIYNEEVLVAFSFFFFVIFVSYYFADNISMFIDERIVNIKYELQNFLNLKKNILENLCKTHEKVFLSDKNINNLKHFTNLTVKNNSKDSEKALKSIFYIQINNKLKNVSYSNFNFKHKLQTIISKILLPAVLVKSLNISTKNINNNKLNLYYLKKKIKTFSN